MTTAPGTRRVANAIPLVAALGAYRPSWLGRDVLAALTIWALLIPQGLAYAQLAGLDPVYGLYASIGALTGYALFGRVRELSAGPEATVALLGAGTVALLAGPDPARFAALSAGLALLVGAMLVLAGLGGLGFITRYLSRPLLLGYVTGSAGVMIVSQLDSLLGIKLVAEDDTVAELLELVHRLPETNPTTLAVGLLVIAVVVVLRRVDRRIPAYLVAVAVAIVASVVLDLAAQGVKTVGTIPPGVPPLGLPDLRPGDIGNLALPAVAIAFLVFADSGVTGQVLQRRGGYRIDVNREFFGLAAANVGAALTSGFPVNGSQSRSFTAADVGARSQLASLIVAALVVLTLLFLTPLFAPLPKAALAGVIVVVAVGLIEPAAYRRLAQLDRTEVGLAITTAGIVLLVGMLAGVVVVIVLSLLLVAQRAAMPRTVVLGPGERRRFRTLHAGESGLEGIVIYRFDGPLFFANVGQFVDEIRALVVDGEPPVHAVVVSAEAITAFDSTAEEACRELVGELQARQVHLLFARTRAPFRDALRRAGLLELLGASSLYPTVAAAVEAANAERPRIVAGQGA